MFECSAVNCGNHRKQHGTGNQSIFYGRIFPHTQYIRTSCRFINNWYIVLYRKKKAPVFPGKGRKKALWKEPSDVLKIRFIARLTGIRLSGGIPKNGRFNDIPSISLSGINLLLNRWIFLEPLHKGVAHFINADR